MAPPPNAFTVDLEDYFQVSAFDRAVSRDQWPSFDRRVVANTRRMLDLLDRHAVRATFFVLGWIAEREPDLVREVRARGHEIASHGYEHRLVYDQSPDAFRRDVRRSRDLLERLTGSPVVAYRAPSFSITKKSLWALEILAEEGFRIDASIFPIYHDRYGIPGANPAIHKIATRRHPLWEIPGSTVRVGRLNLPVGGGGYLRLYPFPLTLRLLARINRKHGRPFILYVHPWELDPGQPRINTGSRLTHFRHYRNLNKTEPRLDALLTRFPFAPLSDILPAGNGQTSEMSNAEIQMTK